MNRLRDVSKKYLGSHVQSRLQAVFHSRDVVGGRKQPHEGHREENIRLAGGRSWCPKPQKHKLLVSIPRCPPDWLNHGPTTPTYTISKCYCPQVVCAPLFLTSAYDESQHNEVIGSSNLIRCSLQIHTNTVRGLFRLSYVFGENTESYSILPCLCAR